MKNNTLNVGLVIADIDEYRHLDKYMGADAKIENVASLLGHTFTVVGEKTNITVQAVCSGIGKVNAASASALLADKCDLLINAGLSGSFGTAKKYELVLGTNFIEHDFDLTPIGYEKSVKPGGEGILLADNGYNADILAKFPFVKSGPFVTGDMFVCTKELHDELENRFSPVACDMESAAVAHSAKLFGKPFVSIRMISDGADDDSADTYTNTLNCDKSDGWAAFVFDWLKTL